VWLQTKSVSLRVQIKEFYPYHPCHQGEQMHVVHKNSIRKDRIVEAAAHLFALQGYHGTSTSEIARLADVSENTLFRHFDHKEDIFWAGLRWHATGLRLRREIVEKMESCEAPEVVFPKIFEMLEISVKSRPELLHLIAVAFLELRGGAFQFSREYISPIVSAINRYLALSVASGKVRNLDSTITTTALVTVALLHPGLLKMIDDRSQPYADSYEAARAYTKFWLDAVGKKPSQVSTNE
jgi:AcrR family transcriptional regulator